MTLLFFRLWLRRMRHVPGRKAGMAGAGHHQLHQRRGWGTSTLNGFASRPGGGACPPTTDPERPARPPVAGRWRQKLPVLRTGACAPLRRPWRRSGFSLRRTEGSPRWLWGSCLAGSRLRRQSASGYTARLRRWPCEGAGCAVGAGAGAGTEVVLPRRRAGARWLVGAALMCRPGGRCALGTPQPRERGERDSGPAWGDAGSLGRREVYG